MTKRMRHALGAAAVAALTVGSATDAGAVASGIFGSTTTRVSVKSNEAQVWGTSSQSEMSLEGRFTAFVSTAQGLVTGDTNGVPDVFVRDRAAGTTRRVSVSSSGAGGNGPSLFPAISGDGNVVAYVSDATNLVTGDTNGSSDVFVRVRSTNLTQVVSIGAGVGALANVYRRDRATGVTKLASVGRYGEPADSHSFGASVSPDGLHVGFTSNATNLVPGDTNNRQDVFMRR